MNDAELDRVLAETLEDARLSRAERRALRRVVAELSPTPADLARYRSRAFDLARRAMSNPATAAAVLDWLEETIKVLSPAVNAAPPVESRVYFSPDDDCPRRIIELIEHPHTKIDICVFTITFDRIAEAIVRAHQRGAAVRLITDREKVADLGSDIYKLQMAGVDVRPDRSRHHMHHKFALFDDRMLVTGSFNWTRAAALDNDENLIVTADPNLVNAFARAFERLWDELG